MWIVMHIFKEIEINGQTIKFPGDGYLPVFNNKKEAEECANGFAEIIEVGYKNRE